MMDKGTHAVHAKARESLPVCSLILLRLLFHLEDCHRHKSESHSLKVSGQKV